VSTLAARSTIGSSPWELPEPPTTLNMRTIAATARATLANSRRRTWTPDRPSMSARPNMSPSHMLRLNDSSRSSAEIAASVASTHRRPRGAAMTATIDHQKRT
jgi:hypothetical protein